MQHLKSFGPSLILQYPNQSCPAIGKHAHACLCLSFTPRIDLHTLRHTSSNDKVRTDRQVSFATHPKQANQEQSPTSNMLNCHFDSTNTHSTQTDPCLDSSHAKLHVNVCKWRPPTVLTTINHTLLCENLHKMPREKSDLLHLVPICVSPQVEQINECTEQAQSLSIKFMLSSRYGRKAQQSIKLSNQFM